MIITELYKGQGLGNQLWCYVVARVIAADKGYEFGIKSPENFKGSDFMSLDFGRTVIGGNGPEGGPPRSLPQGISSYYAEKPLVHPLSGSDIRIHDDNLAIIPDGTMIDGLFQDESYILDKKDEIREWLRVHPENDCRDYSADDMCVINFRGGSYARDPEFFLPKKYWEDAIAHMKARDPDMRFIVITDDVETATPFFPDFEVRHFNIAADYCIIKNARNLILSNSSFAWFPAWLSIDLRYCIAPKYWARHNISDGYWSLGYNMTRGWMYQDRDGKLSTYEQCRSGFDAYIKAHPQYFQPKRIRSNYMVVSNYNNDILWIPELSDDYVIYDQSDKENAIPASIDPKRVTKSHHTGHNISDYLDFIIERYDSLPNITIFTKGNAFPRHFRREYFERVMNNDWFTPLEDAKMHDMLWPKGFFAADGGFSEINNSIYLKKKGYPLKYFNDYNQFLRFAFKDPIIPRYTRFAPGAMYIVPKAHILKYPKVFYENLRTIVTHSFFPGEAFIVERALHTIWAGSFELTGAMLRPIDPDMTMIPPASAAQSLKSLVPMKLKMAIPAPLRNILIRLLPK